MIYLKKKKTKSFHENHLRVFQFILNAFLNLIVLFITSIVNCHTVYIVSIVRRKCYNIYSSGLVTKFQ